MTYRQRRAYSPLSILLLALLIMVTAGWLANVALAQGVGPTLAASNTTIPLGQLTAPVAISFDPAVRQ